MITVPYVAGWRGQPGFETQLCPCVQATRNAVEDCSGCAGIGLVGMVPLGIYRHGLEIGLLQYRGDKRFDPRTWET